MTREPESGARRLRTKATTWLAENWRRPPGRRLLFVALFSLALSFVPMLGSLGYFGALATAPVFAWLGIFVGVDHGLGLGADPEPAAPMPTLGWALRELAGLWLTMVALLALGALWNPNCDLLGGLSWFVFGPACSGALGVVAGLWGARLVVARRASRPRALLWGSLPFWACLGVALWRLYFDPVVFAFDPFWGHFAGPIYDESVSLGRRDLNFRVYNFAAAAAALALWLGSFARVRGQGAWVARVWRRPGLALTLVAGVGLSASYGLRPSKYGFHQTRESLREVLRGQFESDHFIIHYPARTLAAVEIEDIAREHEHAWRRLEATLGRAPQRKLHSWIFDDEKQKRWLFGAGNVEVSMPYRGEIYLTYRSFPHNVLHHELAHSFAGEFGDPLMGLSRRGLFLNVGLIEGVANALAPRPVDELDLHDQAAVLDRLDKRPPLGAIMGLGFWSQSASRAYTAAGSFCLWLLEQHGPEALMAVYQSAGDFEAAYGTSLATLETQWVEFLRARTMSEASIEKERLRFERRSVFRRPCAHRAAQLGARAERALGTGDTDAAIEALGTLCEIEAREPHHRLALATAQAIAGQSEVALATIDDARGLEDLTDMDQARIEEAAGDVALAAEAWDEARAAYTRASGHALRENPRRALQIKLRAAELGAQGKVERAAAVARYFSLFDPVTPPWVTRIRSGAIAVELGQSEGLSALGHYLAALQLSQAGLVREARPHIEMTIGPRPDAPDLWTPELRRAAGFLLVELRMRQGDDPGARRALSVLEELAGEHAGYRLRVEQWRARLDDWTELSGPVGQPVTKSPE